MLHIWCHLNMLNVIPYCFNKIFMQWKNVTLTKTYLSGMAPIYVLHTLVPKRGYWHSQGEDHTYQYEVCVYPPCVHWRRLVHCEMVTKGYLKWRAGMACRTLIPDVGQLVLPQIPVEGWIIDWKEHGLLDGLGNTVCFPAHNGRAIHIDGMPCRLAALANGVGVP